MTTKKDIFTIIKTQKIAFCGIAVILTTIYTLPAQSAMVSRKKAAKQAQPEPEIIVENKASQFDDILDDATAGGDASRSALAEQIRAQRAALDAADAATAAKQNTKKAMSGGKNSCDQKLRACMKSKCGNDFTKCAGDGDTMWGDKMDACRRDATCTGEEYRLFATEIKADRDMNTTIASYNAIVDCGNNYNQCILQECGTTFGKCLGKQAGDNAISKCNKIAKSCQEQDSGLASRVMTVFGTLRQDAEAQVAKDEERLHTLRDNMRETCKRLGAMFDERTLDCVYTINFYAAQNEKPYASKKAYAGSSFDCDQNWFGIDITTFKENAFRLTRAQTAASSAMLGGGVGMAVGAVTSGAIDRSIERQKAEKEAKQKCKDKGGKWKNGECAEDDGKPTRAECKKSGGKWKNGECVENDNETAGKENANDKKAAREECKKSGGKWKNDECITDNDETADEGKADDKKTTKADKEEEKKKKSNCQFSKGKWKKGKCECPDGKNLDDGGFCITPTANQKDATPESGADAGQGKEAAPESEAAAGPETKEAGDKQPAEQEKCNGTWENGKCLEEDIPIISQPIDVPKPTVDDTPKLAKTTSPLLQIKNRKDCQNAGGKWVAKYKQCQEKSQTGDSKKKIVSEASATGNNETKTASKPEADVSATPAVTITDDQESAKQEKCRNSGGNWKNGKCKCPKGTKLDNSGNCIKQEKAATGSGDNDNQKEADKQNTPEQTHAQIRNTAYNEPVPKNIKINECRDGKSYTIQAGQSPQAAGVPLKCWEEVKRFAGVEFQNNNSQKEIVSDASAAGNNEPKTDSEPEEIVSEASATGNNEPKTASKPETDVSATPAVTITEDNIESDAQDESWTGFLEEWRCNKGIDECESEYPRLNPEYALWDKDKDKDKDIAIRVPRAIYTIINDFEKACNQVNGEMATHYTYTPLMVAPRPWRKVDEGSVICYTTETNNSFNNIQIAPKIGEIYYTSESEALALGLGDRASYTISFKPGLRPFILDQPERNPFK